MTKYLNAEQVEALRKIDTPTICNLLEMVAPDRRGVGYTTKYLHCVFPNLPPMAGYARTATIRAKAMGDAVWSGDCARPSLTPASPTWTVASGRDVRLHWRKVDVFMASRRC